MTFVDEIPRRIDALPALVAFVDRALASSTLDVARHHAVQFVLEELLTNMIKYAPQGAPAIAVAIACSEGAVDVTVTDRDVECFDPTRAPAPDVGSPLAERRPGGLGLHLIRPLVESFDYAYAPDRREGRTSFRIGARDAGRTHVRD